MTLFDLWENDVEGFLLWKSFEELESLNHEIKLCRGRGVIFVFPIFVFKYLRPKCLLKFILANCTI